MLIIRNFSVALLTAALVLLGSFGASSIEAAELAYPQAQPRFTLDLPESSKPEFQGEVLRLRPTPDDGFLLQIERRTGEKAKGLKEVVARIAAEMNLSELEIGTPAEAENQHGVVQTVLTSRAKSGGNDFVLTVVAFSMGGQQYIARGAGAAVLNKKHLSAFLGMMDSIKPVPAAE